MLRYGATIFLGAFLLFEVELIVGKLALPWFGGTPSVWTVCLLFFQTALLAGYAYAHRLGSMPVQRQLTLHLSALVAVAALLTFHAFGWPSPVTPGLEWRSTEQPGPFGVLRLLAISIGLPFLLLSSTGPLMQAWFAREHPGVSPYRLYALSNAGSLLALLVYPTLVEPKLPLTRQGWLWFIGFGLYAAALISCVVGLSRAKTPEPTSPQAPPLVPVHPTRVLAWIALSACGSVLLLSTTNQLCQDVASMPLLWVLPLALYLLTFIFTFEREGWYRRAIIWPLYAVGLVWVSRLFFLAPNTSFWSQVGGFGLTLFAGCMICHGELYRLRPPHQRLGMFYLSVSAGGALGAVAVGLVAPHVFRSFAEYPLSLALLTGGMVLFLLRRPEGTPRLRFVAQLMGGAGLALLLTLLVVATKEPRQGERLSIRNFFGLARVAEQGKPGTPEHMYLLQSGNILHGFQYTADDKRRAPVSYYTQDSGLAVLIEQMRQRKPEGLKVGVLGLGIGASIALGQPNDHWTFYEINPAMVALAEGHGGFFTFLKESSTPRTLRLGDARLVLEEELEHGSNQFDVLAVDVFSGDAVPVHLLTTQALALYQRHLSPTGVIALHLSNRHLNLPRVGFGLADEAGLHPLLIVSPVSQMASRTEWMILSRDAELVSDAFPVPTISKAYRQSSFPKVVWTDEFNDLWSVRR